MGKLIKLIDQAAECPRCLAPVVRALIRPLGPLPPAPARPRRFIDLERVPVGWAPDDFDLERPVRAAGVRTFLVTSMCAVERDGTPGRAKGRIHAQHWCNLPEADTEVDLAELMAEAPAPKAA